MPSPCWAAAEALEGHGNRAQDRAGKRCDEGIDQRCLAFTLFTSFWPVLRLSLLTRQGNREAQRW